MSRSLCTLTFSGSLRRRGCPVLRILCTVFDAFRLHLVTGGVDCCVLGALFSTLPVTLVTGGVLSYTPCLMLYSAFRYISRWTRSMSCVLCRCSTLFCSVHLCTLSVVASIAGGDVVPVVISHSSACSLLVSSPWLEASSTLKPSK